MFLEDTNQLLQILSEMGASEGSKPTKTPKVPTVFIRSRQDDAGPSVIKPMPEFGPDSLIGRIFLLPPQENGERLRAKVTKKVVEEIEAADGNRIPNINFILDIGEDKVEELITSYWTIKSKLMNRTTLWTKNSIDLVQ